MSRLAFVFDVETSGLIRKGEEYPHILQMSYLLYDMDDKQLIMTYDTFIKPSEDIIVPEIITELTGITQKDIEGGRPIRQALDDFFQVLRLADIIVGHNIEFDKKMIAIEVARAYPTLIKPNDVTLDFTAMIKEGGEKSLLQIWHLYLFYFVRDSPIDEYCTMQHSKVLCNIILVNRRGPFVKWPKLSETYQKLFGDIPENLHNSLTDTIVCLRCFMKLANKEDIGEIIAADCCVVSE